MINNAVGATPASADSGNNNVSQSRTNTFRINGAKASTTDIQLDGAANITAYANQAAAVPQVDAVQELRDFTRNQYGFTLGGPVRIPGYDGRNRSFLFVGYEALRETRAGSYTGTVPTALERAGDFSQTRDAQGNLIVIYDPRTTRLHPTLPAGKTRYIRDPFLGNRMPTSMLSPVGLGTLSFFPSPNQPGDGLSRANNYYSNAPSGLSTDRVDTRVDHSISDAHRVELPGAAALDLRAEVFNALNHVQFAGPGTSITSADFGRVFLRQVNSPRQIQVGARVSF